MLLLLTMMILIVVVTTTGTARQMCIDSIEKKRIINVVYIFFKFEQSTVWCVSIYGPDNTEPKPVGIPPHCFIAVITT